MIKLIPTIESSFTCPSCRKKVSAKKTLWQGIHLLAQTPCNTCQRTFWQDLPVGQAQITPFAIDAETYLLYGPERARSWFGQPLARSLRSPQSDSVPLTIERRSKAKSVVVLNCLDYLYGHSLLKLLNVEKLLTQKIPVIVIIPSFLKWLVPDKVAEVWSVDLPLSKTQHFFPDLNKHIQQELTRFKTVYVSQADSHPHPVSISQLSQQKPHTFSESNFRITFIWREDRPWFFNSYVSIAAKKLSLLKPLIYWQNWQVTQLFRLLKKKFPLAKLTVAGFGTQTSFPDWIDDQRVDSFNPKIEKRLCKIYAESRVVIGVHGSSMILPTAHAGMMVNLLPSDRLGNFANDVIYHLPAELDDPRITSFRYRYLPLKTGFRTVAQQVSSMITHLPILKEYYT